tara:strand:- start:27148 stop:27816 length:669 start_codon:yes stop_codon:yes gene_type:complete
MKYRDNNGFYHDKLNADSNNLWIYTAYAKALGLDIPDAKAILKYMLECMLDNQNNDFIINRKPKIYEPPMSRDELIGMLSLLDDEYKKILYRKLKENKFYYCNLKLIENVSYFQSIKALFKIRNEHRNYIWLNRIVKGFKIAFRLQFQDRYYFKRVMNERSTLAEFALFHLYAIHSIFYANAGNKNLLFLQLSDLNSKILIRFINHKESLLNYFGPEHVFNK